MNNGLKLLNKDERGTITQITEGVIRVHSVRGAKRANHYHKEFGHYCLVTKGAIMYYERPVGALEKPKVFRFEEGELFRTGPMLEHAMAFPFHDMTEFYCFSEGKRDPGSYAADTVPLECDLVEVDSLWVEQG